MTQENDVTTWIYVVHLAGSATDETAARSFMADDPAVCAGVMTAELHPFRVPLEHPPCR